MRRNSNWMFGLVAAATIALSASARSAFATGACCKTDGTCADVANSGACAALGAGSFYLGDGSACASSDCTRSACVLNPLGSNSCITVSQPECKLQEGTWVPPPATCGNIIANTYGVFTPTNGGQFNISGATLFADFFDNTPASTNDFYNMDGDSIWCRSPLVDGQIVATGPYVEFADSDCAGGLDGTDQLAPAWTCGGWRGHWLVQYRSVGSIEGFIEFVDYQLTGMLPTNVPSERGLINGLRWASTGVIGGPAAACQADCGPPGPTGNTGTPVCPTTIDASNTDVPSAFGVIAGSSGDAQWDRKPTQSGYGLNTDSSFSNNGFSTTPQLASLDRGVFGSLNLNVTTPDANTIFDSKIAWSPVAIIANRGTGKENIRFTELQHLYVTGRLPSGENLVGATRDTGSGTRNAHANSLAIDPSQANGDNVGPRIESSTQSVIGLVPTNQVPLVAGSRTQPTNCGGSGIIEDAVRSWRLSIGYTGLVGSSRTEGDIAAGLYEMLNVCKDVDANGVGTGIPCSPQACDGGPNPSAGGVVPRHPGCPTPPANTTPSNNGYVRANLFTVLDNANPLCGYQIGGIQTLGTRGDPLSGPGIPPYAAGTANPAMSNLAARDYIRNLLASIAAYAAAPGTPDANLMPAQLFANKFFLNAAVDAVHTPLNPTDFSDSVLLQTVQDNVRCNNTVNIRDFGALNVAGRVPTRNNITPLAQFYSDGNQNGSYDANGTGSFTLTNSASLNHRHQVQGDFSYDLARNIKDIPEMMKALKNPRKYEADEFNFSGTGIPLFGSPPITPNPLGSMGRNYLVPEIAGDFNGDGNFNHKDIRYFADGLAIDPTTGKLNRCLGWEMVDAWWLFYKVGPGTSFPNPGTVRPEYVGAQPPWHPTLPSYLPAWPDARVLGAAMADVAGAMASPGWEPTGFDGAVNGLDIDYVYANFGNFANLRYDAAAMDLSCDMNGDLLVNQADVDKIVRDVLCTHYGDRNLDGVVNATDDPSANLGLMPAGWADGDFNGDKVVTAADVVIYNNNLGATSSCRVKCLSDVNCDGKRDGKDVTAFILAVLNPTMYDMTYATCGCFRHNADASADGIINDLDIPGFVTDLLATNPCPAN